MLCFFSSVPGKTPYLSLILTNCVLFLRFHTMSKESFLSLCPCGLSRSEVFYGKVTDLGARGFGYQPQCVDSLDESGKVTSLSFLSTSVVRWNESHFICF